MSTFPIERAITDRNLLGAGFDDLSTWPTWLSVLKAAYGRPLSECERKLFAAVSGDRQPPRGRVRELVAVVSRRAGKGRVAGALAVYEAAVIERRLAPGEVGVVAVVSPSLLQARIVRDYARGFLEASPVLRGEIKDIAGEEIRLKNGNVISCLANDYRTLRGRTLLLAIMDEASFLRSELTSTPDIECARALLPGLATTGGMLVVLSSPYRQAGLLYQRHRDFFGKDDADVLAVSGPSAVFNPTLDLRMIEQAVAADPEAGAAEWLGQFRTDLSTFLPDDLIDAAIDRGRPLEIAPQKDITYRVFVDASSGAHDRFTCCIAHREGERVVCDVVRGKSAPFDPAAVAAEFATLAREYRCGSVTGDNYAAGWTRTAFEAAGVEYRKSPLTRSELYLEGLPAFTRGQVNIPDHGPLLRELRLLQRRTARSGKDSVDHGVGGSDDYANALFGALWLARERPKFNAAVAPIYLKAPGLYPSPVVGVGAVDFGGGIDPMGAVLDSDKSGWPVF